MTMRASRARAKAAAVAEAKPDFKADTVVAGYLADLEADFGRYLVSAEETRNLVDRDMGDVTLTELLYRARAEKA